MKMDIAIVAAIATLLRLARINMVKAIEDTTELARLFNGFLEVGRVPDSMNTALLRLLPKTEEGLSDLDKTRPIALM